MNSGRARAVRVSLEDGHLHLEIAGEFRSSFLPVSQSRLVAVGINDCSIEFAKNPDGTVNRVDIFRGVNAVPMGERNESVRKTTEPHLM